jgi:hypothetical protein
MLQWTAADVVNVEAEARAGTDAAREWAYDRQANIDRLNKGLDEANAKGWTVVSMKNDWKTVFPSERK